MSASSSPEITIQCPECQETLHFRGDRLPRIGVCSKCAAILFELDDSLTEIQITKELRILYRRFAELVGELRTESKKAEANLKSGGNLEPIAHHLIQDLEKVRIAFFHHNQFSDKETAQSVEGLLSILETWLGELENWNESLETRENSDALSELRGIRQKEKETITFIRMMDYYFHERSIL